MPLLITGVISKRKFTFRKFVEPGRHNFIARDSPYGNLIGKCMHRPKWKNTRLVPLRDRHSSKAYKWRGMMPIHVA